MEKSKKTEGWKFEVDFLLPVFCKLLAVTFIGFSVSRWAQIIGLVDPAIRFDTMGNDIRWGVAYLAIVQPVAALGLWSGLAWGYVVWGIAAIGEVIFLAFSSTGRFDEEIMLYFHAACLFVFLFALVISTVRKPRAT